MLIVLINPGSDEHKFGQKITNLGINGPFRTVLERVIKYGNKEDLFEPLGCLYLAASLREKGYQVHVIDQLLSELEGVELLSYIGNADLVGISITGANQLNKTSQLIDSIRNINPSVFIVIGGTFTTFAPEYILKNMNGFDCIIRGEAEDTLALLAEAIKDNLNWKNIPGICYLEKYNIEVKPIPHLEKCLNQFHFPARDLVDQLIKHGGRPSVLSSRGCALHCSYCTSHMLGRISHSSLWRYRSSENVLEELDYLYNNFGIKEFMFLDDNFIGPGVIGKKRAEEIINGMSNRKRDYKFNINTRVDVIEKDILQKMVDNGLDAIGIGIESWSNSQLVRYKKNVNNKNNEKALELVIHYGPKRINLGLMLFDPDTTIKELQEQIDFLKKYPFDLYKILGKLRVMPGSAIADDLVRRNKLMGDEGNYFYEFTDPRIKEIYDVILLIVGRLAIIDKAAKEWAREIPKAEEIIRDWSYQVRIKSVELFSHLVNEMSNVSVKDKACQRLKDDTIKTGGELFLEKTRILLSIIDKFDNEEFVANKIM